MRVGIVLDTCFTGIHLRRDTLKRLGFVSEPDHCYQVDAEERGTRITRPLLACRCSVWMKPGYLYLDPQSAYYLATDIHEIVRLRPAPQDIECP